ncbi:nucleotidyltransferase domain-containing protein [Streptomyces sp. NPDC041068]|uniref:nucleotidyltransferase domain-containing protein n=1 Tax=Streptomyces sp. NPDC041068 TaxID=3155130 RepID=UPI0034048939
MNRSAVTSAGTGLDEDGYIAREGSLARVPDAFRPVVAAARDRVLALFGARLDSAYLYGSVPRGTARIGRSDLDLLIVLRDEPGAADRTAVDALESALDAEFEQIDGVGALLLGRERVLSSLETYDLGWFVACLCTPLLGDDLAEFLPRYRPDGLLARETNGDLALFLPRWRERVAAAPDDDGLRRVCRLVSRHLVRTAFTLVMPRWGGWTSDLGEMAEVFARYYPQWGEPIRGAAAVAYEPVADRDLLTSYTEEVGPWLAAEYAAAHGVKAPREPVVRSGRAPAGSPAAP